MCPDVSKHPFQDIFRGGKEPFIFSLGLKKFVKEVFRIVQCFNYLPIR
jgi:hypothetical protein